VGASSGVDARTQTPPSESLTAVERPPMAKMPRRVNGLGGGRERARWRVRGYDVPGEGPDAGCDLQMNVSRLPGRIRRVQTSRITVSIGAMVVGK
jgi:hypothetical protein